MGHELLPLGLEDFSATVLAAVDRDAVFRFKIVAHCLEGSSMLDVLLGPYGNVPSENLVHPHMQKFVDQRRDDALPRFVVEVCAAKASSDGLVDSGIASGFFPLGISWSFDLTVFR